MAYKPLIGVWLLGMLCVSPAAIAGDAALADAAEKRDFDTFRTLLDRKVDVNATQVDRMTALHWAVYHNALDATRQLVKAGAKVQAKNRYEVAPLSLACLNGHVDIVELLLSAGADCDTKLPGGETALMTAARTGKLGPVQRLISHGADVNAREHKEQTALMWAAADGHVEVVEALIAAGADVKAQLRSGFTPLFFAVREGRTAVILKLLAAGCDIDEIMQTKGRPKFGRSTLSLTPLLMAVENGHFELAEVLLHLGADPNARPAGYTALHALTWVRKPIRGDGDPPPRGSGKYSSLDMVRILVGAGADINPRFERGKSELGRFTYTSSTPFLLAAQASDLPLMKLLVELGADVHLPNADGCTPLLAAAGVGALGDGDESAGTEEEAIAAVKFLLEQGADINAIDRNGETAMHGAAYQSRADLVNMLIERGASVDIWNHENRAGWTPLLIALGYRPGNFRPAPTTIAAIENSMVAAGASLPAKSDLGSHRRSWKGVSNKNTPWVMRDIKYAQVGQTALLLDLYMPAGTSESNLVLWVHGGAWRGGSKKNMPLSALVQAGFAVASVDYRLSPVAPFPAQVHDIKAAIRFLRSRAARYGCRWDRIAIAGASAGGHLAALVGTTNDNHDLEGTVGVHLDQSSDVHAIVDLYGPTNFMTILSQSTPHGLGVRVPALELLLLGQPKDKPELAKLASPVDHVDATDPPLLIIHGDQDPQVPINQSHELHGIYKEFDLPVRFEVVHGGAHGGGKFYHEEMLNIIREFLDESLRTDSLSAAETEAKRNSAYRDFALSYEGDTTAGEVVFRTNRKSVCADCHRITGMEKSGPNLDGIGEKYSKPEMIAHLLDPNLSIKRGYEQANVLMEDGRAIVGRVERSNQLLLRLQDLKGERINLNQKDVAEVQFSTTSLMPTGLATSLTKEEFADLVAYLCSLEFGVKDGFAADGRTVSIPRIKTPVQFVPIHTDSNSFANPVWVGPFPLSEDELLVVEHQSAHVWRYIRDGKSPRKELFVDLKEQIHIAGDQGLTSLALHPNFVSNGRYFLEHEVREAGIVKTTIVERQASEDRMSDSGRASVRLLEVQQPAANHNGGCIAFGPDGMLYAGFGDGGPQKDPNGYSQSPRELLGSFIRVDVDRKRDGKAYSIPPDNPYLELSHQDSSIRPEIWATGFREPWRFSFDKLTGDLWVGDVGQSKYEEVCLVHRGENHGWNVREGFAPFSDEYKRADVTFTDPLFAYQHGLGFSVTGGHVYRGDPDSSFYGVYIFGDYNTRRIWGLRQEGGKLLDVRELATAPTDVASFGVDASGELLLVAYSGEIFHIDLSASQYE